MSGIQIPVTDAFDDSEHESVTANLRPEHVEWLQSRARTLDLSFDEVLQAVIDAQMELLAAEKPEPEEKRTGSVVDSLRSANKRLQEMMDQTKSRSKTQSRSNSTSDPSDTLSRLRARLGDGSAEADPHLSVRPPSAPDAPGEASSNTGPSMFDLMDE